MRFLSLDANEPIAGSLSEAAAVSRGDESSLIIRELLARGAEAQLMTAGLTGDTRAVGYVPCSADKVLFFERERV